MDRKRFTTAYIQNLCNILQALPLEQWERVLILLEAALEKRKTVFIIGNGGSAATASHMANDLMLGVAKGGGIGFRVLSLTDNIPVITAAANDFGYQYIFSSQLCSIGSAGDLLIVISASGNSQNLIQAVRAAKEIGITTIGFLGMGGGNLKSMIDEAVLVPSDDYGPIEDVHMIFDHLLVAYFKQFQESSGEMDEF